MLASSTVGQAWMSRQLLQLNLRRLIRLEPREGLCFKGAERGTYTRTLVASS